MFSSNIDSMIGENKERTVNPMLDSMIGENSESNAFYGNKNYSDYHNQLIEPLN